MVGPRAYDVMYRRGAPWEMGPRTELVGQVTGGRLSAAALPPGRAVDLGCGTGANACFLAEQGFDVTGVDFSKVALAKAERLAASTGLAACFVEGDVTAPSIAGAEGPFDLVVDYGTLDDLHGKRRAAMARTITRLTRPGGVALIWCFYDEIAWWRRPGARFPGLAEGSETTLFGNDFTVERLDEPQAGSGFACFVMTRR